MKKLIFSPYDGFADVYTMNTLYDFLVSREFKAELVYESHRLKVLCPCENKLNKLIELIGKRRTDEEFSRDISDIILKGHSDINEGSGGLQNRRITIDHSILKNCVKPLTEDERKQLREKYKVPSDKPVVVLGCHTTSGNEDLAHQVMLKLKEETRAYVVGSTYFVQKNIPQGITVVCEQGVLKDYYAMADISLMIDNLGDKKYQETLHNFIEATEGGPLFISKPYDKKQFGYKQLLELGVIKSANGEEDLVAKIKSYLANPNGEELREKRRKHLEKCREIYLNDLLRILNRLFNFSEEKCTSNLMVYFVDNMHSKTNLRIVHPETYWEYETELRIPIAEIPENFYQKFKEAKK